jgi:hypothetical protein
MELAVQAASAPAALPCLARSAPSSGGMASENPWGAPRIHGELLRLGLEVSERSVSRYPRTLPRTPRAGQTWTTFLRNHRNGIATMDFFSVPTATFRVLHGRIEGLNNKIGVIKHRAYGFHSFAALAAMVFLCCTDLQLRLPI